MRPVAVALILGLATGQLGNEQKREPLEGGSRLEIALPVEAVMDPTHDALSGSVHASGRAALFLSEKEDSPTSLDCLKAAQQLLSLP